jgi:hypothetical protein
MTLAAVRRLDHLLGGLELETSNVANGDNPIWFERREYLTASRRALPDLENAPRALAGAKQRIMR